MHVPLILEDDGYTQVNANEVQPGDIVIYRHRGEITHVGVVISHKADIESARWKTEVLSQWGADGEYIHDLSDVNESFGRPDKFYSEKRTIR